MEPKQVLERWVDAFNEADAEKLGALYAEDAVNHQIANEPVRGKQAIQATLAAEFAVADMVCLVENMFQDGDWAMMEWKDPKGFRGCGFFQIKNGLIVFQRGYWDKLSVLKANNLPIPE